MKNKQDFREILSDYGLRSGAGIHAKGQEKIKEIIEEAVLLLEAEGSAGFSMRELARRSDIQLSVLQHYFKNRTAVVMAVSRYLHHIYDFEVTQIFERGDLTPENKVEQFVDLTLDNTEFSSLVFTLHSECRTSTPEIADMMFDSYDKLIELISAEIEPLTPGISSVERRCRVAFLLSSLDGAEVYYTREQQDCRAPAEFKERIKRFLISILFSSEDS
ncbi:MAG: TetR/AcrR family transcriptional regulator [Pseudomonadota bacterium]